MSDIKKETLRLNEQMRAYSDALYAPAKKPLVFGHGDPRSRAVLIGEAPGEQETLEGKPFVDKAGKTLDEFSALTGLKQGDLYITNAVKLRPTAISKAGRTVNRPPNSEEITLLVPWFRREMELIKPAYIVTLGNVALRAASGNNEAVIGRCHGALYPSEGMGAHLYPVNYPAAVIYNRSLRQTYRDDLEKLQAILKRG